CRPLLDSLDQCAATSTSNSSTACAKLQTTATSSTAATVLQDCIRASCAASCKGSATADGGKPPPPAPTGNGTTSCSSYDENSCSCITIDYTLGNSTTCNEDSVGAGVCCLDQKSSGTGYLSCHCNRFVCSGTTDDCQCQATGLSGDATTCAGTNCCVM